MVEQLRPIVVVVGYVLIKPYVPSWGKRCCFAAGQWSGAALPQGTAVGSGNRTRRLTTIERKACSGSSVLTL